MRKVSEYIQHANDCRDMAAKARRQEHKLQLQQMAEAWEMLATERQRKIHKAAARDANKAV
jgi:hypothetical protein